MPRPSVCPKCSAVNPFNSPICAKCGAAMSRPGDRTCAACGETKNTAQVKHCISCGKPLPESK